MQGVETCPECEVPEYVTSETQWQNNGLIVQRRDPRHTATFIESENIDALLHGVENIVKKPIEPIILETRRRASRAYMDRVIPEDIRQMVQKKELDIELLAKTFFTIGHVLGYGRMELINYRYERDRDDFFIIRIEKPYSVLLGCADPAAAVEAILGTEMGFAYARVSEDIYDIRIFWESHPEEFKGRLMMKSFQPGPGDIELEACPSCGVPRALSNFHWDLEKGLINSKQSGRRMVFFGPTVLDAVFGDLESQLGKDIPGIVIDAQRRLTRDLYRPRDIIHETGFREALALRGGGNLRRFDMKRRCLSVRLDNAAMHLVMVGMFQGYYEIAHGGESQVDWQISNAGDLEMEVTPKTAAT
jgi:hypothetical protein